MPPRRRRPALRGLLLLLWCTVSMLLTTVPPAAALTHPTRASLLLTTPDGVLRGVTDQGTDQLLGVRYAAAPLGRLRWQAPAPNTPWRGVRDADHKGDSCPQQWRVGSEDCLFLNVYRPHSSRPGERLPVMTWLHGGGFTSGSGNDFDPLEFVTENRAIVVTVNYRLGALGFLASPALARHGTAGNYGLLDQQAALRWVHTNIAGWGGDPHRVSLAGESAGAGSVCAQLASPQSRDLFSTAIIESDDCIHDVDTYEEAQARATAITTALHCDHTSARQTAACLRAAPVSRLLANTNYIAPNISGTLPLLPATAIATGRWNAVPVLMGSNREEGRAFATDHLHDTEADWQRWLTTAPSWPPLSTGAPVFGTPATAQAIAAAYAPADFPQPYPVAYAIAAVITDSGTRGLGGCTSLRTARSIGLQQPIYYYQLQDPHPPRMSEQPADYDYAAAHAYELPYLFPRLADAHGTRFSEQMTPEQHRLAQSMRAAWGDFIRAPHHTGALDHGWQPLDRTRTYRALEPGRTRSLPLHHYSEQHRCALWDRITS
ncbi:carboxylesterase family protein [Streptomyces sp. NPDC046939]|uniref:carboxylesterase/lipase family protein n=1 Tax=Streptomyces sp. NPDC046939 TaxID=3155376 RepID=UPI0033D56B90